MRNKDLPSLFIYQIGLKLNGDLIKDLLFQKLLRKWHKERILMELLLMEIWPMILIAMFSITLSLWRCWKKFQKLFLSFSIEEIMNMVKVEKYFVNTFKFMGFVKKMLQGFRLVQFFCLCLILTLLWFQDYFIILLLRKEKVQKIILL